MYKNLYTKYALKMNQLGGTKTTDALAYATTLIDVPYRWLKEGEEITGDDKVWGGPGLAPTREYIDTNNKCIVCSGLTNVMRRHVGLSVPFGAGGTISWFKYLVQKHRLEFFNPDRKYPKGTLLIETFTKSNFSNN